MCFGVCVCMRVRAHGIWGRISRDRGLVTMGHQQEMTNGGLIGRVTDDVT